MRRRHLLPSQALVVAVLTLTLLASACHAIHEDEQGLRDWVLRLTGEAQYAAVSPTAQEPLLYVAGAEGAVAALSLSAAGGTEVAWRVVLPDPPRCLAAHAHGILVATEPGSVWILEERTGRVEDTFHLRLPPGARVSTCDWVAGHASVLAQDEAQAYRFTFDVVEGEETIVPSETLPLGTSAGALLLDGPHLWVRGGPAGTQRWDAHTGALVVAPDGPPSATEPPCPSDDVCHLRASATAGGEGRVRLLPAAAGGLEVQFPSNVVKVPGAVGATSPRLLTAFRRGEAVYALVRAGNGHLLLVEAEEGVRWERYEGLSGAAASLIVEPNGPADHFHFNKQALVVSRFGVLYSIPLDAMGQRVEVVADVSAALQKALGGTTAADVSIRGITALGNHSVAIRAERGERTAFVHVHLVRKAITAVTVAEDALLASPTYTVTQAHAIEGTLAAGETHAYVVDAARGVLQGYQLSAASRRAVGTWRVRLPHPIVSAASGNEEGRTAVVNALHVFPNRTGREPVEEVRRRYPMRNVVAVAYYEPAAEELSTLVVVALDAVTGSILATTRHKNVQGAVRMVVVEHAVVYYFLDAAKMRYGFGVWELFEEEPGPRGFKSAGATIPQVIASFFVWSKGLFSSRATRPPVVVVSTLGAYGGPVADMSVTTSINAIARKSLVLAFESGRVAVVELRHLLAGGQMPLPGDEGNSLSHVLIPSVLLATHKYRLALPRRITVDSTALESSTHVFVSGLDLFYVRSSSGKPFDFLNSDFNKPLLVTLVCAFIGLSGVARYLVARKSLHALWK